MPEPGEVAKDAGLVFRPAAGAVDVLDAEQEPPARPPAELEVEQRREGVAEMQFPVRARARSGKRAASAASAGLILRRALL